MTQQQATTLASKMSPAQINRNATGELREQLLDAREQPTMEALDEDGDIPDEIEESLYLGPDGTMTTYHQGDEEDPSTVWFGHSVPTVTVAGVEFSAED